MSLIKAKIETINSVDTLHSIKLRCESRLLTMVLLELPGGIKEGVEVLVSVKPSHIAIGLEKLEAISYSNQIEAKIYKIDMGEILTRIEIKIDDDTILESIITSDSAKRLKLYLGKNIVAFIKASELSIAMVVKND